MSKLLKSTQNSRETPLSSKTAYQREINVFHTHGMLKGLGYHRRRVHSGSECHSVTFCCRPHMFPVPVVSACAAGLPKKNSTNREVLPNSGGTRSRAPKEKPHQAENYGSGARGGWQSGGNRKQDLKRSTVLYHQGGSG